MRTRRGLLLAISLAAPLLVLAVTFAGAGAQSTEQPTGIRVRGQGVITAPPDLATVSINASLRRDTPGQAFDAVAQRVAALTDALAGAGIAARDIQTSQLTLFAEYGQPEPGSPPPLLGWRARQGLTIRIRDFSRVAPVVDNAVTLLGDAAELQGIGFSIEDTDALTDRARDLAADDAREKAEKLAARLGVRLGPVEYVQETSSPLPSPVQAVATPAATATPVRAPTPAPAPALQIAGGERTLSVTLDVIFAIERAAPSP